MLGTSRPPRFSTEVAFILPILYSDRFDSLVKECLISKVDVEEDGSTLDGRIARNVRTTAAPSEISYSRNLEVSRSSLRGNRCDLLLN